MILLDADVLLIGLRYPNGVNSVQNRKFFTELLGANHPRGVIVQALLETVGVLSYSSPTSKIANLFQAIPSRFGLKVLPDPVTHPQYLGLTIKDLIVEITKKISVGDAAEALLIQRYAPQGSTFITWNSKHFVGRIPIPVLTPAEWLHQQGNTP